MLVISKHRTAMFNILQDIYRSNIKSALGFKGGTMAYFFYGLDRFSVDLDFDLLKPVSYQEVAKTLVPILQKQGALVDAKDKNFTYFFLLSHQKGTQALKVEVNKKVGTGVEYGNQDFYGINIPIQKQEVALASKILACLERKRMASRDFFDVNYYLGKGVLPNENYIKGHSGKSLKESLEELVKKTTDSLNERNILMGLGELVDNKKKVWVKNHLKKELLSRLEFMLKQAGGL